jgi:putative copper resistance protein D
VRSRGEDGFFALGGRTDLDQALIICRLLHYGSAILLFGIAIFQSALAPTGLKEALASPLRAIFTGALAAALITTAAWLFLISGQMAGDWAGAWTPSTWYAVLADTEFGQIWRYRLAGVILLCGLFLARRPASWRGEMALSTLFLASLGLIGHAAMLDGVEGWVNRGSQIVHLLASGFWLGSLVPLLLCLRKLSDAAEREGAGTALRRFSGAGHFAVGIVLATGIVNTRLVLDRWPVHFSSLYQTLLAVKIGLVVTMICLALVNRYIFVPRLKSSDGALGALRASTITEIILGVGVIGLVSVFGTLPPR